MIIYAYFDRKNKINNKIHIIIYYIHLTNILYMFSLCMEK